MKAPTLFLSALLAGLLLAGAAEAQPRGRCAWADARMFDTATITTVSGTVAAIERVSNGPSVGIHLRLQTGDETVPVHLGPAFYVDAQELKIAEGDRVEVVGSRVQLGDAPALIAQEVRKGESRLRLRDEAGFPAWRGQGPMSGRRMGGRW